MRTRLNPNLLAHFLGVRQTHSKADVIDVDFIWAPLPKQLHLHCWCFCQNSVSPVLSRHGYGLEDWRGGAQSKWYWYIILFLIRTDRVGALFKWVFGNQLTQGKLGHRHLTNWQHLLLCTSMPSISHSIWTLYPKEEGESERFACRDIMGYMHSLELLLQGYHWVLAPSTYML